MDQIKKAIICLLSSKIELEYYSQTPKPDYIIQAINDIDQAIELLSANELKELNESFIDIHHSSSSNVEDLYSFDNKN